jgi:hypothetical protein
VPDQTAVGLADDSTGATAGCAIALDIHAMGKQILLGMHSAKTHLSNHMLPARQGACLASRLCHHPAFGIPSAFTNGHGRTKGNAATLASAADPDSSKPNCIK